MKNNVYVLYDDLAHRYGDVFALPNDAVCINRVQSNDDLKKRQVSVCRIGSIDIETGVLTASAPVRLDLWDEVPGAPIKTIERGMAE